MRGSSIQWLWSTELFASLELFTFLLELFVYGCYRNCLHVLDPIIYNFYAHTFSSKIISKTIMRISCRAKNYSQLLQQLFPEILFTRGILVFTELLLTALLFTE